MGSLISTINNNNMLPAFFGTGNFLDVECKVVSDCYHFYNSPFYPLQCCSMTLVEGQGFDEEGATLTDGVHKICEYPSQCKKGRVYDEAAEYAAMWGALNFILFVISAVFWFYALRSINRASMGVPLFDEKDCKCCRFESKADKKKKRK